MAKLQDKDFKQVSGGNSEDIQEYENLLRAYQEERERLSYKFLESSSDDQECIRKALDNLGDAIMDIQEKIKKCQENF